MVFRQLVISEFNIDFSTDISASELPLDGELYGGHGEV